MKHRQGPSWAGVVLLVAALAQLSPSASAEDSLVVSRYGFCITESEGRCSEVAVPGAVVDYERLPEDGEGGRYIGFYSRQRASPGTTVVHILYGEDQDTEVRYVLPEPAVGDPGALRRKLEQILRAHAGPGSIVVTALVAAPKNAGARNAAPGDTDQESFVFSRIPVPSPGEYSGKVVGLDGKLVPGTETVSFSVIRVPPAGPAQ